MLTFDMQENNNIRTVSILSSSQTEKCSKEYMCCLPKQANMVCMTDRQTDGHCQMVDKVNLCVSLLTQPDHKNMTLCR